MTPPDSRPTLLEIANRLDRVVLAGNPEQDLATVARMVHEAGPHAGGRFVALDAAALPEVLFKVELFGHCGGAFAGQDRRRMGRLELDVVDEKGASRSHSAKTSLTLFRHG